MSQPPAKKGNGLVWAGVVTGLLVWPIGVIIAIVLFAKSRVGPGIAVLMVSGVGAFLAVSLVCASAFSGSA